MDPNPNPHTQYSSLETIDRVSLRCPCDSQYLCSQVPVCHVGNRMLNSHVSLNMLTLLPSEFVRTFEIEFSEPRHAHDDSRATSKPTGKAYPCYRSLVLGPNIASSQLVRRGSIIRIVPLFMWCFDIGGLLQKQLFTRGVLRMRTCAIHAPRA